MNRKVLFRNERYEIKELKSPNSKKTMQIIRQVPFVKAIVVDKKEEKILLLHDEFSTSEYGFFLPGKKMFSTMQEYDESLLNQKTLEFYAKNKLEICLEELECYNYTSSLYKTKSSENFYYEIIDFELQFNSSDNIKKFWKSFDEIIDMAIHDMFYNVEEEAVLLTYILEKRRSL